jgi:hypothetical protein
VVDPRAATALPAPGDALVRHRWELPVLDLVDDPSLAALEALDDELTSIAGPYWERGRHKPGSAEAAAATASAEVAKVSVAHWLGLPASVWDDPVVLATLADRTLVRRSVPEPPAPPRTDLPVPDGTPVSLLLHRSTFYNDEGYTTTADRADAAVLGMDAGVHRLRAEVLVDQFFAHSEPDEGSVARELVEVSFPPGTVLQGGDLYLVWRPRPVYSYYDDYLSGLEPELVGAFPTMDEAVAASAGVEMAHSVDGLAGTDAARHLATWLPSGFTPSHTDPDALPRNQDGSPLTDRYGFEYGPAALAAVSTVHVDLPWDDDPAGLTVL